MQLNEFLKGKARQIVKYTWVGPGKFGVFITICIIVIAIFESLGLSNREKNLESRNFQNIVLPLSIIKGEAALQDSKVFVNSEKPQTKYLDEKLKIYTKIDFEKKSEERENILIYSAIDQFLYNNNINVNKSERVKEILSIILKRTQDIVQSKYGKEDIVFTDL
jgi:hypothetical protein